MEDFRTRTVELLGAQKTDSLKEKTVAIFGLGGVGGFVVEALARVGVGNFIIFDCDSVQPSNINRQILALNSNVGCLKTDVEYDRIMDINPEAKVEVCTDFLNKDTVFSFDADFIVDAIDTVSAKLNIISYAAEKNIPIISSMGTAGKLNPFCFKITTLDKTTVCPLARVMRREVKKRGQKPPFVIFSDEVSKPARAGEKPGSVSFVPSVCGLLIAYFVINGLVGLPSTSQCGFEFLNL